jgi:SAM-dependent methyltransferase
LVSGATPARLDDALAHTHTGEEYFKHITSLEPDRRARAAFQQAVLGTAPEGGALFDFGAGPGIDARYFAERGYTVEAYDVDPAMSEFFAEYCRDLMEQGCITLQRGSYPDFLSRQVPRSGRRADLVISNFAPLNLVDDLGALFAKFHALSAPNGRVLASVINPYSWDDMKYRWWWRRLPELWRHGFYVMPGPQAPHVRRGLAHLAAHAFPYFRLARVFRGLPAASGGMQGGIDAATARRFACLHLRGARFMFLLFDKREG